MSSSPDFVTFALDLLAPVGPVQARAMFGGHGLYARGVMFALLDDDELFLKTDEACRGAFVAAGCRQWSFVSKTQRMENTSYFRPPDEAHEDAEAMLPWARLALEAALRAQAEKARRAAAKEKEKEREKEREKEKRTAKPRGTGSSDAKRSGAKSSGVQRRGAESSVAKRGGAKSSGGKRRGAESSVAKRGERKDGARGKRAR